MRGKSERAYETTESDREKAEKMREKRISQSITHHRAQKKERKGKKEADEERPKYR